MANKTIKDVLGFDLRAARYYACIGAGFLADYLTKKVKSRRKLTANMVRSWEDGTVTPPEFWVTRLKEEFAGAETQNLRSPRKETKNRFWEHSSKFKKAAKKAAKAAAKSTLKVVKSKPKKAAKNPVVQVVQDTAPVAQ